MVDRWTKYSLEVQDRDKGTKGSFRPYGSSHRTNQGQDLLADDILGQIAGGPHGFTADPYNASPRLIACVGQKSILALVVRAWEPLTLREYLKLMLTAWPLVQSIRKPCSICIS